MEACLVENVCSSLRLYLYRNAIFLCERLYAEFPSENNLHLLATCYFRSNQAYRAYHILKGTKSVHCRYLFALACFEMDSLAEAEAALWHPNVSGGEVPNGAAGYYMLGLICRLTDRTQAAVGHYTQALLLDPFLWSAYEELCLLGADEDAAGLYGETAVLRLQQQQQQNLHWELQTQSSAPASLCMDHFESNSSPLFHRPTHSTGGSPRHSRVSQAASAEEIVSVGINPGGVVGANASIFSDSPLTINSSTFVTPTTGPSQVTLPQAPGKIVQEPPNTSTSAVLGAGTEASRATPGAGCHPQQRRKFVDEGKFRKVSGRLFDPVPRRSSRLAADGKSTLLQVGSAGNLGSVAVSGVSSGNGSTVYSGTMTGSTSRGGVTGPFQASNVRKGSAFSATESNSDDGKRNGESLDASSEDVGTVYRKPGALEDESQCRGRVSTVVGSVHHGTCGLEGAMEALNLLRIFADGYRHLCMYRSQEAMQTFSKLPQQQFSTGWVLCQVARACSEMVDYPEAERLFSWARRISSHRLEGTDVYSTVLYHLKKDVELSYLAQETIAMDRHSPQAWCVMGNCFSLQKDHETALKFFQRALQIDSHYTYAYTLCGHEYAAMEDFEEGLTCYRNAIRMDSRHYNAWYGLGTIYFRQEKYELAEYHFRRALNINSRSSVLHCYLGMALHALKKNAEALLFLEQAMVVDAKNPLPKYQKATVLMSDESYHDALAELEQLKEVAPQECSVYFLMGKIFKRLDLPERAMYNFCIALDLKPSTAEVNLIKMAIEKLHVPDDLEEENL